MPPRIRRIALNTGGGDAPGLNAVIRAAVLSALNQGWEVYGIRKGYDGLLGEEEVVRLDRNSVRGITHLGGTILGTTNRGNPFERPMHQPDGSVITVDRSDEVIEAFRRLELDALIAIGGDGSLRIANEFARKGLPVVGVPKTIDNDLAATDQTFGFDTAVGIATEALDRIRDTAESHDRVMLVEVMGRHAGWIALTAGIAGGADAILIPEIPYRIEPIAEMIRQRRRAGKAYSLIVVAEGAKPHGGEASIGERPLGAMPRLMGAASRVADALERHVDADMRVTVLGHIQRGGSPSSFDRVLATRYGVAAAELVERGEFGKMVALRAGEIVSVDIAEAVAEPKLVDPKSQLVEQARTLGICFGE